jgi:hypothetical protein
MIRIDFPDAVSDGADAMERPLDPRPVVVAECADVVDDVLDVRLGDLTLQEGDLAVREAGFGLAAEVHHDLDQLRRVGQVPDRPNDVGRQGVEEQIKVVDRLAPAVCRALISHVSSCHLRLAYCWD